MECGSPLPLSRSQPAGPAPFKHPSQQDRAREAPYSRLSQQASFPPNQQPQALYCCEHHSSLCARSTPARPLPTSHSHFPLPTSHFSLPTSHFTPPLPTNPPTSVHIPALRLKLAPSVLSALSVLFSQSAPSSPPPYRVRLSNHVGEPAKHGSAAVPSGLSTCRRPCFHSGAQGCWAGWFKPLDDGSAPREHMISRSHPPYTHSRELTNTVPFSLLTSHFSLLTSHFSLLTSHFSLLTSHFSHSQSQRDCVPQPKVGLRHAGLPWVRPPITINPDRVASPNPPGTRSRAKACRKAATSESERRTWPPNSTSIPIMRPSLLGTIRPLRPISPIFPTSTLPHPSHFSLLTSHFPLTPRCYCLARSTTAALAGSFLAAMHHFMLVFRFSSSASPESRRDLRLRQ